MFTDCPIGCITCSDDMNCMTCDTGNGYGLYSDGLCVSCGAPNPNYFNGPNCIGKSNSKFYFKLLDCPIGCTTCNNNLECTTCDISNYYGLHASGLCVLCGVPNPGYFVGTNCLGNNL